MLSSIKVRSRNLWERLSTSFWLIPSLMSLAAITLFGIITYMDRQFTLPSPFILNFFEPVGGSGARVILSTIAGSTITIVGTVFSITILTLTLASNQFGPRLLKNFIRSRGNQFVLGSLIATFIFALCVLTTIQPQNKPEFVPRLAVDIAVVLALVNVGILIYFIHHVAVSIQADNVIREVTTTLLAQIETSMPEMADRETSDSVPSGTEKNWNSSDTLELVSKDWGYIQALERGTLLSVACKFNLVIEVLERPGAYVSQGQVLGRVNALEKLDDKVLQRLVRAFVIGNQRSPEQDLEYAIHQLVEVAVRALSPGINDPYTAMACIDHLGSAFSLIARRRCPADRLLDDKGYLRVTLPAFSFERAVSAGLNQVRQHAAGNAAVLIRILEVLKTVLDNTGDSAHQKILQHHAKIVMDTAQSTIAQEADREDARIRWKQFETSND
ncbi:MAG: DUF2254 domain-containing protein [Gammaproteobacteria bacterium]